MKKLVMSVLFAAVAAAFAGELKPFEVQLDVLATAGHVQGLACTEKAIYVAHQKGIEVLDWQGKPLRSVEAPCHLGGIACDNGLVYGAIILRSARKGEPQGLLRVWDSGFKVVREKRFPINLGSVGVLNGTVYLATDRWMKPAGPHDLCTIKTLDLELNEKADTDIDLGYKIRYGVQGIATDGQELFLCCYGGTSRIAPSLKSPVDMTKTLPKKFSGSEGLARVPRSLAGREAPVFMTTEPLNGGFKAWRKDPKLNPPRIRFHFWEWSNGKFSEINE